jgi:hypothetical protein
MITEILETTINEVLLTNKFEITEFQLGKEPYTILKQEIENKTAWVKVNISSINEFMGIPVKLHHNDDAIMYALKLKPAANIFEHRRMKGDVTVG